MRYRFLSYEISYEISFISYETPSIPADIHPVAMAGTGGTGGTRLDHEAAAALLGGAQRRLRCVT